GAADAARLAGRHLAEEGLVDRVGPMVNRGDFDDEARAGRAHVARILAERPFVLPHTRWHEPFDDDLRVRRHLEIVRLAAHDLERRAAERAGHAELVAANPGHG